MKMVYTHENKILVENAKNLLSLNGIQSFLKNEFASGGMGDLPLNVWPELWVTEEQDIEKATALMTQLTDDAQREAWTCQSCGEVNEPSFDFCWMCQSENDSDG